MTRSIIAALFSLLLCGVVIYCIVLLIRALRKYLHSTGAQKEKVEKAKSPGEVLKRHRSTCRMTQEFVAEALGVSRQAVSKWERGTAEPSTGTLIALAALFGVMPEALLREIE